MYIVLREGNLDTVAAEGAVDGEAQLAVFQSRDGNRVDVPHRSAGPGFEDRTRSLEAAGRGDEIGLPAGS